MNYIIFLLSLFMISCHSQQFFPSGCYESAITLESILLYENMAIRYKILNDRTHEFEVGRGSMYSIEKTIIPFLSKNELYKFDIFVSSNTIHTYESIKRFNWYFEPGSKTFYRVSKNDFSKIVFFKFSKTISEMNATRYPWGSNPWVGW